MAGYNRQTISMPHLQRVQQHSAMSAAGVVMNIAHISAYPIISKLGDVSFRQRRNIHLFWAMLSMQPAQILPNIWFDAFFSGVYVVYWSTNHNSTSCWYLWGYWSTGFALTKQVFMADMTSLDNRGVWSTLFDSHTTIHTLYLGTIVAQRILDYTTWRCGWGM
ncbi:hypothetical protein N7485_006990 [Penicillium canescens]|nr:hypothetical protein N7485_006990 [Penicillium canescens]